MSTFLQSPSGHRTVSSSCMPIATYTMRKCLAVSPKIFGGRKCGFFKSNFPSSAFIDDPSIKSAGRHTRSYFMPSHPLTDEIHPPGNQEPSISYVKGMKFSILSILKFTTQVVPTSLPSRDAYKTFICKGLFTTTHAIQIGSMISPVEKAYLEPLVTWHRSYSERFWLPDRNSVPGSTGIGLALSLRTLSTCFFSLRRIIRSTCKSLSRYFHFNFLSIKHTFSSSLHEVLNFGSTELKCSFPPTAQEY